MINVKVAMGGGVGMDGAEVGSLRLDRIN